MDGDVVEMSVVLCHIKTWINSEKMFTNSIANHERYPRLSYK